MITGVSEVKTFIGVTDTSETAFLDQLVASVDASIKKWIDRDIEQATYTDYYSGNNSKVLVLNEYPVANAAAVTGVYQDDFAYWGQAPNAFDPTLSVLVQGTNYAVVLDGRGGEASTARLFRLDGVWAGRWEFKRGLLTPGLKSGVGNIKVTYTAGYAAGAIPQDLQLAFWQICAQVRAARSLGRPMKSEGLGEYHYDLEEQIKDALRVGTVEQVLSRYRRVRERYRPLG